MVVSGKHTFWFLPETVRFSSLQTVLVNEVCLSLHLRLRIPVGTGLSAAIFVDLYYLNLQGRWAAAYFT